MRKLIASAVVAGLVVAGGAGVAWAGVAGDAPPTSDTPTAPGGHRGAGVLRAAFQAAAAAIGVSSADLKQAVQSGKTVADVARDHHVDPTTVVNAVVTSATQAIDQAVANGTIDANRAAQLKGNLPQLADRLVNQKHDRGDRRHGRRFLKDALGVAAKTIGVSTDDLKSALKSGKTIGDVAKDHKVDVSKVTDAIVDAAKKQIDAAVKDGKLDKDKAKKLEDRLPDLVKKLVNGELRKERDGKNGTPASAKS
jgi:ribosomal protein S20